MVRKSQTPPGTWPATGTERHITTAQSVLVAKPCPANKRGLRHQVLLEPVAAWPSGVPLLLGRCRAKACLCRHVEPLLRLDSRVCTAFIVDVSVVLLAIFRIVFLEHWVPCRIRAGTVKQNDVVNWTEPLGAIVGVGSLPNDLVPELNRAEYRVKQHLQVMTRGWIAVQVDRPG